MQTTKLISVLALASLCFIKADAQEEVDVGTWASYRNRDRVRCEGVANTYYFEFSSKTPGEQGITDDIPLREDLCEYAYRFHGDARMGVPEFTSKTQIRPVGECWKEMARIQIDHAKCCYETADSVLARPWLACGTRGNRYLERRAKDGFIKKMIIRLDEIRAERDKVE